MSRPLPDPAVLEEARQHEVRRLWLYRAGTAAVAVAFYVNLMIGLFGTALAAVSQQLWWVWAALASAVLVALPVIGFFALQAWRERQVAESHQALMELLQMEKPSRLAQVAFLLALTGLGGGLAGGLANYDAVLAWSLIVALQLTGIPFRFWRLGPSWGWAAHLVLWVAGSIALVQLSHPWVGDDGVMWIALVTIFASPTMVVNLTLAKWVKAAAVATPGQGWGRLEPLLAFHHLAEVMLERGTAEELEPWMRRIVALRPRFERTFVLLGRVLRARHDPVERDYWVLGATMMPASAEVFARLAEVVDDPELALAYARFAEANAHRRPTGLDTARFSRLVAELEAG